MGVESQGFSKACQLPLAQPSNVYAKIGMSEEAFSRYRSLLFTVAYEMLGSASDAEDVVQETWLRWANVNHAEVREPRAYLVRIVTHQALNPLRSRHSQPAQAGPAGPSRRPHTHLTRTSGNHPSTALPVTP